MNNVRLHGGVCEEYCHRKCKSCISERTECHECADYYAKDGNGDCVVESGILNAAVVSRPLFNFIKRKGIRTLFFLVDDLWLYNFHSQDYDGVLKTIFQTIKFV